MKKDFFKNVKTMCKDNVLFVLIFVPIILCVMGVVWTIFAINTFSIPLKEETIAYIVFASVSYFACLIHFVIGTIVFYSYPKHKKIAHLLFRKNWFIGN